MANLENSNNSVRAAGAYWASRVEFLFGNPSKAIEFLRISSNYSDTFSVKPRVQDINGPIMLEIEDRSHFVGVISCQFSANA